MSSAQDAIESALKESQRLRSVLKRSSSKQVHSDDEKQVAKATAQSWFCVHRANVTSALGEDSVRAIDEQFKLLINAANCAALRTKYTSALKQIEKLLGRLQSERAVELASHTDTTTTTDTAPNFSALASDPGMQAILTRRWQECARCLDADAALAATVMMGGLLEGLLLARVNQLSDKREVFTAKHAPKDKTGSTLKLNAWTLKDYIEVAHELSWISKTTKDVGEVVRDYRNYIHPQKEYSQKINISSDDARMLWEVAKTVTLQILKT